MDASTPARVAAAAPRPTDLPLGDEVLVRLATGLGVTTFEVRGASSATVRRVGEGSSTVAPERVAAVGHTLLGELLPAALFARWSVEGVRHGESLAFLLGAFDGALARWNARAAVLNRTAPRAPATATMATEFALDDVSVRLAALCTLLPPLGHLLDDYAPLEGFGAALTALRSAAGRRASDADLLRQKVSGKPLVRNTLRNAQGGAHCPRQDTVVALAEALAAWRRESGSAVASYDEVVLILRLARLVTALREGSREVRVFDTSYRLCRDAFRDLRDRDLADLAVVANEAHCWQRGVQAAVLERVRAHMARCQQAQMADFLRLSPRDKFRFVADGQRAIAARTLAASGADSMATELSAFFSHGASIFEAAAAGGSAGPVTSWCPDRLHAGMQVYAAMAPWASDGDEKREAHYRAAVAMDPSFAFARMTFARFLLDRGRASEAAQHLDAALAVAPDDPDALAERGVVAANLGDSETAKEFAQRAATLGSRAGAVYLAVLLRHEGRAAEAAEVLGTAIEREPRNATLLRVLSETRAELGDEEGAARLAREAGRAEGARPPPIVPGRAAATDLPGVDVFGEPFTIAQVIGVAMDLADPTGIVHR